MNATLAISLSYLYEWCGGHRLTVINAIMLLLNIVGYTTFLLVCFKQYKRK